MLTIQPNSTDSQVLTWQDLQAVTYLFDAPFCLPFSGDQVFFSEKVVRLVPQRRLVAFGTWLGRPVVAKLFFASHHAKRQVEKEMAGIKILQANKIPTPALYCQGEGEDQRLTVLLFERIIDAKNLAEIWQEKSSIEAVFPVLQAVTIELATQHVQGVMQHDLHLKNFLLSEKIIYTLDGATVSATLDKLTKYLSMQNFALFLSQLGVGVEIAAYQEQLFRYYAKARGWLLKKADIQQLFLLIKKWNAKRFKQFAKKMVRASTDFGRLEVGRLVAMYDRQAARPEFLAFLHDPETAFTHQTAVMLKAGGSSTVIKVTLDQSDWVVKRYNLKTMWHRLRRSLRRTRAFTSWRLAQKLSLFGIATAKPAAFIEKRCLGLRGVSYYVTEYVAHEQVGDFFRTHRDDEEKVTMMIDKVTNLLKSLSQLAITHGDLKATNILINAKEQPLFIDLDGAKEHADKTSLRRAWKKEVKRFLENFYDQPTLLSRLQAKLED